VIISQFPEPRLWNRKEGPTDFSAIRTPFRDGVSAALAKDEDDSWNDSPPRGTNRAAKSIVAARSRKRVTPRRHLLIIRDGIRREMEEHGVLVHTDSVRIHRARLNGDRLSPNRDAAFDYARESALPRFLRSFSFHFLLDDQRLTLQRGLAQES
jgi:hypothetical protein